MGTFDFMSGMAGPNANAQAAAPMQQYAQFAGMGNPQGMDYSQVLGGGQAQSASATQGLDFSKIGQWALQQGQYPGQPQQPTSFQGALAALNSQQPNPQSTDMAAYRQPSAGRAGAPLGQVQQGAAGYIGNGTRSGLLGAVR